MTAETILLRTVLLVPFALVLLFLCRTMWRSCRRREQAPVLYLYNLHFDDDCITGLSHGRMEEVAARPEWN